jgi:DNA-binding transcriptional LysR family regulator
MFAKLFAESGFSLDRLRALLEVGAAGSIVKAAGGDPVRQSQFSRQIKELEDFFRTRLIERHGKGTRLTASGRELARISRFFMMGLSNFQRGCLAEEQTFRIGANATFIHCFLLPMLSGLGVEKGDARYATEVATDEEIERRLHDLTLDFGVVENGQLSRPLQTKLLGEWKLQMWVPKALRLTESKAFRAFEQGQLPLVRTRELDELGLAPASKSEAVLGCDSFLEARLALDGQKLAAVLPDFLSPAQAANAFLRVRTPKLDQRTFGFHLAWNPRLLRLNPHTVRRRDWLADALSKQMRK